MADSQRHREEIVVALAAWKESLAAILRSRLGPAPSVRAIASALDIGRGAGHALSHILQADDGAEIGGLLPGIKTRQVLLERFGRMDLDPESLHDFATAQEHLDDLLRRRAPSKVALISLLADGSTTGSVQANLLEGLRKRFESDAMLLGASAEHLVAAQVFAPASHGDLVDMAGVQLLSGVRQWRPDAAIELYRPFPKAPGSRGLGDDPTSAIVSDACTPGWADRVVHSAPPGYHEAWVLRARSSSRSEDPRTLRLGFGESSTGVGSARRTEPDDTAEMGCPVWLPIRMIVLECWLHRDLPRGGAPIAGLYHAFNPRAQQHPCRERCRIPIPANIIDVGPDPAPPEDLDGSDAVVAYRRLMTRAVERLGTSIDDYAVHRLTLPWAPTGGLLTISWPLAPPIE